MCVCVCADARVCVLFRDTLSPIRPQPLITQRLRSSVTPRRPHRSPQAWGIRHGVRARGYVRFAGLHCRPHLGPVCQPIFRAERRRRGSRHPLPSPRAFCPPDSMIARLYEPPYDSNAWADLGDKVDGPRVVARLVIGRRAQRKGRTGQEASRLAVRRRPP